MLFQAIDDKNECIGVYANGKLDFKTIPENLTKTWKYSGSIQDDAVEYAWLYSGGKNLQECCPDEYLEDLTNAQKKMRAFMKSFEIARINLREHCAFELIPHDFLMQFCEIKNKITQHVFETHEKPENYEHLDKVQKLLHKIRYQNLNIETSDCKHLMVSTIHRNKINQIKNYNFIDYDLFGTVTGRLTTKQNSFPILTLRKDIRQILKPNNDLFVALDYNGAEVRTLLELQNQEQPQEDIHDWNAKHLFEQEVNRDECKVRFFAWLYDPESDDINTNIYDKETLLDTWYDGTHIKTPYGRRIEVEKRKAFNYLIQSTTADRVLDKAVKIDEILQNHKSYVSHIIHDEIVLDYCDEDRNMIPIIREIFEDGYLSSVSAGKDGYNLKELNL
tara:strand:- start:768 stop:1937 length:1170 start_codon:yes stop_codon:yes gene_type:complete